MEPQPRLASDPTRWPWLLRPLPSFAVAALVVLAIAARWPEALPKATTMVLAYLITPAGQEVWIAVGSEKFQLSYIFVGALIIAVNLSVSLFFTLAVPLERLFARFAFIGRRVDRFVDRIRRSATAQRSLGAALFVLVALPIHTGGAIVGSLAGRALGLRWYQTLAAVMGAVTLRTVLAVLVVYNVIRGLRGR